jgi:hypothetical protein
MATAAMAFAMAAAAMAAGQWQKQWGPAVAATTIVANAVTCACVLCHFVSPAFLIGSH